MLDAAEKNIKPIEDYMLAIMYTFEKKNAHTTGLFQYPYPKSVHRAFGQPESIVKDTCPKYHAMGRVKALLYIHYYIYPL